MKYLGSKANHADDILKIVLAGRKPGQTYVEPFVGGANVISRVPQEQGPRIGADINPYMIALHKAQQQGMKDQAAADTAASLQGAKDANAIRDKVAQEGDSSVDADLSQFVRKPPTHG